MECRLQTGSLKNGVVLRVFLGKRIAGDAVMFQKVLDFHFCPARTMLSIIVRNPSECCPTVAAGP